MTNDEARVFYSVIRHWTFFRHSSLGLRHFFPTRPRLCRKPSRFFLPGLLHPDQQQVSPYLRRSQCSASGRWAVSKMPSDCRGEHGARGGAWLAGRPPGAGWHRNVALEVRERRPEENIDRHRLAGQRGPAVTSARITRAESATLKVCRCPWMESAVRKSRSTRMTLLAPRLEPPPRRRPRCPRRDRRRPVGDRVAEDAEKGLAQPLRRGASWDSRPPTACDAQPSRHDSQFCTHGIHQEKATAIKFRPLIVLWRETFDNHQRPQSAVPARFALLFFP